MPTSLITIIWSVAAGACFIFSLLYLMVWVLNRQLKSTIYFSVAAFSVSVVAVLELLFYKSTSVENAVIYYWWINTMVCFVVVSLTWFIFFYFDTGRKWLVWMTLALRAAGYDGRRKQPPWRLPETKREPPKATFQIL